MDQNQTAPVTSKKPIFTVKNILRSLALLCLIFVFCPSFLVSCSGQNVDVNIMTAVGGVKMQGEQVVEPRIYMIICLLIPIALLVFLFLKNFPALKTAKILLGCMVVDIIFWIAFRSGVLGFCSDNYCEVKTTTWYVLNMISMLGITAISVLLIMKKLEMETDVAAMISHNGNSAALDQLTTAVGQLTDHVKATVGKSITPKEKPIGFCSKCGTPIAYGCKFCVSCGTPVPESMLAEAEAAKRAAEEVARKAAEEAAKNAVNTMATPITPANPAAAPAGASICPKCGAAQVGNPKFCAVCGTPLAAPAPAVVNGAPQASACPICGTALAAGAKFCAKCGTKID